MALTLIKIRIMPSSPDTDLDELEKKVVKIIKKSGSENVKIEREPIAFGLTSLIILFGIDEEKPSDPILEEINKIPNVSSAEIIDFRRAIG